MSNLEPSAETFAVNPKAVKFVTFTKRDGSKIALSLEYLMDRRPILIKEETETVEEGSTVSYTAVYYRDFIHYRNDPVVPTRLCVKESLEFVLKALTRIGYATF